MEALALGLHERSLDGFYHLCRTLCVKDTRYYDAFDEAFLAYFKGVHTDALEAHRASCWSGCTIPKALEGLTDEERAALEALDLEELRELFEERLREQKERHDGGNRWIGTGGTSPFGTAARNPTGMRVGGGGGRSRDGGRRRAPLQGVPQRRRARRPPDRGRAARAAPARPRGRRSRSSTSTRPIDKTCTQRRRARGRVPAAAPQPRQGAAADGRRRLDGSARRAGAAGCSPRRRAPAGSRSSAATTSTTASTTRSTRTRCSARAVPVADLLATQRSRREARGRRRRADAPGRAARSGRLDVPRTRRHRAPRASSGCAGSRTTSAAPRGSTPSPSGSGRARRSR